MPQQFFASRDHWVEDNRVILASLRPMHGADRDLGLSSIAEKSFDQPPLCSVRSQHKHVLFTDLAREGRNDLSDVLSRLVACANAIFGLFEVPLRRALFEVYAVGADPLYELRTSLRTPFRVGCALLGDDQLPFIEHAANNVTNLFGHAGLFV